MAPRSLSHAGFQVEGVMPVAMPARLDSPQQLAPCGYCMREPVGP